MSHPDRVMPTIPENAPSSSWWCCPDSEFHGRLEQRVEAMRLSKLGQQDQPAYAPNVRTPHVHKPETL